MAPAATSNASLGNSNVIGDTKARGPSSGEIPEGFTPPVFDDPYKARQYLKARLALAFRIFAKHGFDEGVAGHITVRVRTSFENLERSCTLISHQDPVEPTSFWLNPFGVAWNTIEASDLILVDKNAKVVDGGPVRLMNTAGMKNSLKRT